MVDSLITQPFGLVLIVTAHVVFNDPGHAVVTGIIGQNVTLLFTFQTAIRNELEFSIYKEGELKVSDILKFKERYKVYPENSSVSYIFPNLTENDTEFYWASFFEKAGPPIMSNKVQLIVQRENRSTTVPPVSANPTEPRSNGSSSFLSSTVVTFLVVSPLLLSVVLLPFLICCLLKPKDRRQEEEEPQRGSNPTVQETIEEPANIPGPSLVYSVLDFPKRPPAAVEFDPSGTEYATVSYLTERRQRSHTDQCKSVDRSRL